jgi:hypothetical protein
MRLIDPVDPCNGSLAQPSAADIDLHQLRTARLVGTAAEVFRMIAPDAMAFKEKLI